jgi:hypothetical protein
VKRIEPGRGNANVVVNRQQWEKYGLTSGAYFVTVTAGGMKQTRRVFMLK